MIHCASFPADEDRGSLEPDLQLASAAAAKARNKACLNRVGRVTAPCTRQAPQFHSRDMLPPTLHAPVFSKLSGIFHNFSVCSVVGLEWESDLGIRTPKWLAISPESFRF